MEEIILTIHCGDVLKISHTLSSLVIVEQTHFKLPLIEVPQNNNQQFKKRTFASEWIFRACAMGC
jgi:hypothetical protein